MSSFDIYPLSRFSGSGAAIRRPKEIACFSYDDDHQYHLDERSLRYYYPPRLGADLSKGFETFRQLDDTADDHLDSLLRTLMALEGETGKKCEADVITWRGMITKIMVSPYDNWAGSGFEMNATNFQGTIFIEENKSYKLEGRRYQYSTPSQPGSASQELMSYWGYKFETISLLPEPWDPTSRDYIDSREDLIVNNYAQYCSVVKTGIGKAKMVIGGEVDAVWDAKPENRDDPINWVELKTTAVIGSDKDMLKYERKLLRSWIQSFLLGVPKIIMGFRSRDGILQRLEELETQSIPRLVKRNGLKSTITTDGVWRIRRRDKSSLIEVLKLEQTGYGNILSEDFLAWRSKRASNSKDQLSQTIE